MATEVRATQEFQRTVKKLHAQDKKILDEVIKKIVAEPMIGATKKATCQAYLCTNSTSIRGISCLPIK